MLLARAETDSYAYERQLTGQGLSMVAGVDEAGRGPLAGPVVAGCVVLPPDCDHSLFKDSKKLSAANRAELYDELHRIGAMIGIGTVSAATIDRINILQASLLAMKRALEQLPAPPEHLLVDGKFKVPVSIPQTTLIKGESKSASIAAASIIAKVWRDRLMDDYHQLFPLYNFARHKGYPTAEHRKLIGQHGPCEIHRRSFKGVREHLG